MAIIDIKKTEHGKAQRDAHRDRQAKKEAFKTFEDMKKAEKDDLLKQLAILAGLIKAS
jgi:hypothetical protein